MSSLTFIASSLLSVVVVVVLLVVKERTMTATLVPVRSRRNQTQAADNRKIAS
jgi:hypothetical protein